MRNVRTREKQDVKSLFHAERHCQRDRITYYLNSVLSPPLIALHNDSATEWIVGHLWGHFHYDFRKKLNNLRLPILFPLALSREEASRRMSESEGLGLKGGEVNACSLLYLCIHESLSAANMRGRTREALLRRSEIKEPFSSREADGVRERVGCTDRPERVKTTICPRGFLSAGPASPCLASEGLAGAQKVVTWKRDFLHGRARSRVSKAAHSPGAQAFPPHAGHLVCRAGRSELEVSHLVGPPTAARRGRSEPVRLKDAERTF